MFTDILWRFLILETFVMGALCCKCPYEHPQKHFCQREFVLLGDLMQVIEWPTEWLMKIKRVFKEEKKATTVWWQTWNAGLVETKVSNTDNGCYVMESMSSQKFGESKNGNLYTQLCYGNMKWSLSSPFYKHALETYYKDNCDCYKELPSFTLDMFCYWRNSVLERRGEKCSWANTTDLQFCRPWLE